eukprot:scaffold2384_cov92-Skeletonema_dohrnii-CCMP3373.AAC.2
MASFELDDSDSDERYGTPPPLPNKMEKVSPSIFFSSPVIDLTKRSSSANSSIAVALESDSSSCSGGTTRSDDAVVVNEKKRKYIETIASSSEEEEVGETSASVANSTKKSRDCTSTDRAYVVNNSQEQMHQRGAIKRGESTSGKELPITRPIRQYFHARTNQPFASARELQDDSDCEDTNDWLHALSESLINDFDDVSEKEKIFMNLWNRFIKCHHVIADRDVPRRVETFILVNRDKLIGADLRMNLLLHLSNLWDYGLISKNRISSCMAMYDDGESQA